MLNSGTARRTFLTSAAALAGASAASGATSPESALPAYARAQAHSELVDAQLGFHITEVEAGIDRRWGRPDCHKAWIGLPPRALQTPYTEIREILHCVRPVVGQTVVDLGAGYGRMSFVIAQHYPGVDFKGFELVPERVAEGLRCGARGLVAQDLTAPDFVMPVADFYFIYDFGTAAAIHHAFESLKHIARGRPVTVIGRGRASRDVIERRHPWLGQVVAPEHHGHYSVYRSAHV